MKLDPCLIPHTKSTKDFSIRPDTIKFCREETGDNLLDIVIGYDFVSMCLKPQANSMVPPQKIKSIISI